MIYAYRNPLNLLDRFSLLSTSANKKNRLDGVGFAISSPVSRVDYASDQIRMDWFNASAFVKSKTNA